MHSYLNSSMQMTMVTVVALHQSSEHLSVHNYVKVVHNRVLRFIFCERSVMSIKFISILSDKHETLYCAL